MPVRHNNPNGGNIVHKGSKGGNTGCGIDTTKNSSHWENTSSAITCNKDGCKN